VRAGSMIKPVAMVATGGLLVAAAVAGTRAAGGLEFELRPLVSVPGDDVEVVLLAAAVLCVPLLIVSMFLRRRAQRESEGDEFGWLRRLVLLAVLVASVLVLRELLPALDEGAGTSDTESADTGTGPAEVIFSGWTAVLAAILAMSALAMLWWRRRVEPAAGPQATGGEDNDGAAATRAGRAALDRQWDDARAAVVGCYAAMEDVLEAAGGARRRAETPEELLHRAVTEGHLAPGPGRALTELFLTARYSSAPVASADVAVARQALRTVETGVPS
jgi:hypothetical protein